MPEVPAAPCLRFGLQTIERVFSNLGETASVPLFLLRSAVSALRIRLVTPRTAPLGETVLWSRRHRPRAQAKIQAASAIHPPPTWPDLRSQLAAVVENSNDAIFSRTFDGIITTWNAAAVRIFGYRPEEAIGKPSQLLLPPGKVDEFRRLISRLRRGQVVEHFETERLCRDGQRIHVALTLSLIRNASHRAIGFSTIARDITEQIRMREALAHRELELDDLFEHASIGLVLLSRQGLILRANPSFGALLGRDVSEVVGKSLGSFQADPTTLDESRQRLARRETIQHLSTEFLTAKGDVRFVLIDADGLWERGCLVHTRWFIRDISRRRELERELLENSDRERRAFAQELHDGLGQQLSGVAYLSNVLRERLNERGAPETESATRIFNLVRKAIEDARRMARGLSPIGEDPEGLMEALRELAMQTAELRGLRCRLVCQKPVLVPDPVMASHLYRMAQEAVNNALKHARPRTVTISLRHARNQLHLVIADDGKGMEPLSPTRKGLGLRIMQYRAGLIRGSLSVDPRHPRGTKVTCLVALPSGA